MNIFVNPSRIFPMSRHKTRLNHNNDDLGSDGRKNECLHKFSKISKIYILLVLCLIFFILSFIPLAIGLKFDESTSKAYVELVASNGMSYFFACSTSIALYILIDLIQDGFLRYRSVFWLPRLLLILNICSVGLSFLLVGNDMTGRLFMWTRDSNSLFVIGAIAAYMMYLFEPEIFNVNVISTMLALLYACVTLNYLSTVEKLANIRVLLILLWVVLAALLLLIYSICCLFLAYNFYRKCRKSSEPTWQRWWLSLGMRDVGCILINISLFIAMNAVGILHLHEGGGLTEPIDVNYLIGVHIIRFCCSIAMVVIPGRISVEETARLRYDLDVKKTFVRYVSHEIRTPMNILCMGLDLVQSDLEKGVINEITIKTIDEMKATSASVLKILNDLLLYEKLHSQEMVIEKSKLRPVPFIVQTLRQFNLQARQSGINIRLLAPEMNNLTELDDVMIEADPSKLGQAISNLVSNALKFTPRGGNVDVNCAILRRDANANPEISMISSAFHGSMDSKMPKNAMIRISVIDSGNGVHPKNQSRLFKEVVQFDANAQQGGGGSGLGLWLTKRIVRLHGGRVGMKSAGLGLGSTFFVDIPIHEMISDSVLKPEGDVTSNRAAPDHASPVRQLSPPGIGITVDSEIRNNLNILVVDDSALNRKMTGRCLTSFNHSFEEAEDGIEAVKMVEEAMHGVNEVQMYDVIIMDNCMPNMNGPQATLAIRKLGYTGVIVGLTGHTLAADIEEFISMGADAVLSKPLSADELHNHVQRIYHSKRAGGRR